MSTDTGGADLLTGLRILSFCHYLQGPAASQYLADLGADVLKVEPLGGAVERRLMGPGRGPDGAGSIFVAANRNVRSIAIDLKQSAGRQVVLDLLDRYDIVIENYRPGVMDRLGLGYSALREVNPNVVYASASGYGSSGPLAAEPGQDLLVQGLTGLVASSGERPTPTGAAVADQHGAALLALGILASVVRRNRTGIGCRVEGSLFNAGIDLQMEALTFYLNRPQRPFAEDLDRAGQLATWYHAAPYGVYAVSDGHITISMDYDSGVVRAFPDLLDGLDGCDPVRDRDAWATRLAGALLPLTRDEALERLRSCGVWAGPVLSYEDVERHPQTKSNGLIRTVGDGSWEARVVMHPNTYDGEVPPVVRVPPYVGADTEDVLAELGYASDHVGLLRRDGIVTSPVRTAEPIRTDAPQRTVQPAQPLAAPAQEGR
jgi:crotonobetainyl-CoA:carnitine CoA-transferase CaiB-like acyl-CoA transferase